MMRLLLDTQIYLWWLQDSPHLSTEARFKITAAAEVYVSSASIWEAAIKLSMGKLDADMNDLVEQVKRGGFLPLSVTALHVAAAMQLPDTVRDPFDRVLIAQANVEPLRLLTADASLKGQSVLVDMV